MAGLHVDSIPATHSLSMCLFHVAAVGQHDLPLACRGQRMMCGCVCGWVSGWKAEKEKKKSKFIKYKKAINEFKCNLKAGH